MTIKNRHPSIMTADIIPNMAEAAAKVVGNGTSSTRPHEELQYLNLVREILEDGEHRPDR